MRRLPAAVPHAPPGNAAPGRRVRVAARAGMAQGDRFPYLSSRLYALIRVIARLIRMLAAKHPNILLPRLPEHIFGNLVSKAVASRCRGIRVACHKYLLVHRADTAMDILEKISGECESGLGSAFFFLPVRHGEFPPFCPENHQY